MNAKRSRLWQLTDLLQWTTRDIDGHAVGQVADVIIDQSEGRVAYLRIRMNGPDPDPKLLITVPWSAISRFSPTQGDVQIAARKETLVRLGLRGNAH